jgi:N-acetyl sugar amidotransferase
MTGASSVGTPYGETHRQCARCVLDTGDRADLQFDDRGICNHCRYFDELAAGLPRTDEDRRRCLDEAVSRIKQDGAGRKYDCVIGLSGGVDSSYLARLARHEGLRPLAVHLDNGWNSELAVGNIHAIVERLGYDLHTHVIDWHEFRELQLAYLRASVIDIEILTDHAIHAVLMSVALKNGIRYVLSGNNVATEGVLPYSWIYRKSDHVNIQDIHRKFGRGMLRTYPFLDSALKRRVKKADVRTVNLLDCISYDVAEAKAVLASEIGWRDYGGKHFESIFTRFYQTYILPRKFGIDKRKAHLASLICSGQMTKPEALEILSRPPDTAEGIRADSEYVLKKLGLSEAKFEEIMNLPIRQHFDFEMEGGFFDRWVYLHSMRGVWRRLKPLVRGTKSLPFHSGNLNV